MKFDGGINIDQNKARTYLDKLINDQSKFEIVKKNKQRTIKQNAYMHVCITLFAIHFGYTLHEAKTDLKRDCPYHEFTRYSKQCPITGKEKIRLSSTKDYTTDQAGKFIDWLREYAGVNGCYIPTSDEYLERKWLIDLEIERNKKYL